MNFATVGGCEIPIHLADWFMDHLITPASCVLDDTASNGGSIGE
jgi:hypothetical protein